MARKTEHILEVKEKGLDKITKASDKLAELQKRSAKLQNQFRKGEISAEKFTEEMNKLKTEVIKLQRSNKKLTEQQKKQEKQTKRNTKAFKDFSKSIRRTNRFLKDAARIAAGMLAAFGVQATARGLGTLAKGFIDVAKAAELYQKRLELLLGSQEKAIEVFDFMIEYGIRTGHSYQAQMEGITELAAVMRGQEGKDIIEWIKMAGDFTAVFATKGMDFQTVLTNIVRAASAGMGAAITFMRRGISEALEFRKGVKYTREDIVRRFSEVWKKAYQGAANEIGETFWGLMERLKNWFWKFRMDVMDAGIFEILKTGAEKFLERLEDLRKSGELAKRIDQFTLAMAQASLSLVKFGLQIDDFVEDISKRIPGIGKILGFGTEEQAKKSAVREVAKEQLRVAGAPAMSPLGALKAMWGWGKRKLGILEEGPIGLVGPPTEAEVKEIEREKAIIKAFEDVIEKLEKRILDEEGYLERALEKSAIEREMGRIKFMFPKGAEEYRLEKELIEARKGVRLAELEEPRFREEFVGAGMRRREVVEIERRNMKEQMKIRKELRDYKLDQIEIELEGEYKRYEEEQELFGLQVAYNVKQTEEQNKKIAELERKILDETNEIEKEKLRDILAERQAAWTETKKELKGYSDYLETVVLKHERTLKETEKKKEKIESDYLEDRKKTQHEYNEKFRIIDAGTREAFVLGWKDAVRSFGTLSEQIYEVGKKSFDALKGTIQSFYTDIITLPLRKKETAARVKELEAEASMMQDIYQMKLDNINKEMQLNQMRRESEMIGEDMYTTEYIRIMNDREKLQRDHADQMVGIHDKMQNEMQDDMKSFADYWDAFWTQMANVAAEQMARSTMTFLGGQRDGGFDLGSLLKTGIGAIGGMFGLGGAAAAPAEALQTQAWWGGLGLQKGGIVTKPTVGMIGEGSNYEAVVPLPDNRSIPVELTGAGAGGVVNVFNISAVDANSFVELCQRNPQGIVSAVSTDMTEGGQTMTTVRSIV